MTEIPSETEIAANKSRIEIIREIGFMGYRFLITLNSGAFIVLLTFIGNIEGSTKFAMNLSHLKLAMSCFLAAIAGTFVSMTIAYISAQLSLLNRALPLGSSGIGFVAWQLVPVILSFFLFLLGGYFSITGIVAK